MIPAITTSAPVIDSRPGQASPSSSAPSRTANTTSDPCMASTPPRARGWLRTMPVAWKNRMVAITPAERATPAASQTCEASGAPERSPAYSATSSHSGWLARVMPNTRWVALRFSPLRSRCSSSRRLPSGNANAATSTQPSASQAEPSSGQLA